MMVPIYNAVLASLIFLKGQRDNSMFNFLYGLKKPRPHSPRCNSRKRKCCYSKVFWGNCI